MKTRLPAERRWRAPSTIASPRPETTNSHWSAPRWRLSEPPSAPPGGSTISAACEAWLPRITRKPLPKRNVFFFMDPSYSGPSPPVPGAAPELPMLVLLPLDPGVVGVAPDEDEVPPALPLPVVMPSSFRHFSRSAAIMPRHLLLDELEAPLLPDTPGELVPGVVELPVVPALLPVPPYVEPVPCATDTPEIAKSAAAVAAQMSFKVASFTCCCPTSWARSWARSCWSPCRCCSGSWSCCPTSWATSCWATSCSVSCCSASCCSTCRRSRSCCYPTC